jgi:hypothetical protein
MNGNQGPCTQGRIWETPAKFITTHFLNLGSRESVAGTATGYGLESSRFESRRGRDFPRPSRPFLSPTHSRTK